MNEAVRRAIERETGAAIVRASPVSGGDINDAYALELAGGRQAFVKTSARLPPLAFQEEARGLAWLAEARAVAVPEVLAVSDEPPGFLVLQAVHAGPRTPAAEERFGRELAALHRAGAPSFGLERPNYLATLPQDNSPEADWPTFYRARRLAPLLERAEARGLVSRSLRARFDRLFALLPSLVGPAEPPARLHGDLWGGNWIVDRAGVPWLIDPAVYGGHREIDLAMMQLFGGFGRRVFDAYAESFPLAPGAGDRVELHQLYPLLAHVVMFGSGYVGQLQSALSAYVR